MPGETEEVLFEVNSKVTMLHGTNASRQLQILVKVTQMLTAFTIVEVLQKNKSLDESTAQEIEVKLGIYCSSGHACG